jgi:hypothetical protein
MSGNVNGDGDGHGHGNFNLKDTLNILMIFNMYNIYNIYHSKKIKKDKIYIKDLKIDKYYKCKSEKVDCSICCNSVKYNEYIRKLSCNHVYHKKCIDKWLISLLKKSEKMNCPLCRKILF